MNTYTNKPLSEPLTLLNVWVCYIKNTVPSWWNR